MIAALRARLGWRAARRLAHERAAGVPAPGVHLLLVLPDDSARHAEAWAFVGRLDLPPSAVTACVPGERVEAVPDRFAGAVVLVDAAACDAFGVPRAAARARAWTPRPTVAVNLAGPSSLAAAVLVGGAPAGVRVGPDAPDAPERYDLATPARPDGALDPPALLDVLARLRPPVLPVRP